MLELLESMWNVGRVKTLPQPGMRSLLSPTESSPFWSFWWNGFLAVLPAKITISILVELRPEFAFCWNDHRNGQTRMGTRIDQNGIQ